MDDQILLIHALAAAGSVSVATALTYPLDTIKVLVQVGSSSSKRLAAASVVDRVRSLSGFSGLYNGLGWSVTGRILSVGSRFGIYEILTAFSKDGRDDNYVYVSEAMMAGLVAGAVESVISSPFEMIKLRAQVISASRNSSITSAKEGKAVTPIISRLLPGYTPDKRALNSTVDLLSTLGRHHNLTGSLKEYPWMLTGSGRAPTISNVKGVPDLISLEGWGALWRGLRSGIVRDSVFGGVFFSSWQFLHRAMLDWKAAGMVPSPRSDEEIGPLSPAAVSLTAGFSGAIAAAASNGFDTARSRSQCLVLPKYITMERKLLGWRLPGTWFERTTGIHPSDRNLLGRGLGLRMARSSLASFMIVGGYYMAVNNLIPR